MQIRYRKKRQTTETSCINDARSMNNIIEKIFLLKENHHGTQLPAVQRPNQKRLLRRDKLRPPRRAENLPRRADHRRPELRADTEGYDLLYV